MTFKRALVALIVGGHRALFTMATALLGVAGSLVADDPCVAANWFLLGGASLLMYVEDECGEIKFASKALESDKPHPLDAQIDVFDARNTRMIYIRVTLAALGLVAGIALLAT